jgi:hypothetical protein
MDERYLNFPVIMLQDAFKDIRETMCNAMDYAGYVHTLKLEYGDKKKKMKDAGKYFCIKYGYNSYDNGEAIYNSLPPNLPMTGINKDVCFDFYENPKTPDEIAVLLAFLAIKSVIGKKPYVKMTNDFLIARMGGYKSIKDMPEPLPEPLAQYSTRRKMAKIKLELQTNWNVNYYSYYTRGFYVSLDNKFSLNDLALQAEKRRKTIKEKQLKQKKQDARKKALIKLTEPNDLDF